jgi:hypothetical protein
MWTTLNNPFNLSSAEIKDRLEDVGAKIGANLVMNVKQADEEHVTADAYHC